MKIIWRACSVLKTWRNSMAKAGRLPDFRKMYPEASEEIISVLKETERKDEELRREIEQHLTALLSAGEKATKVLEVDKKAADQYFGEEDQAVTWAEYGMEIWLR